MFLGEQSVTTDSSGNAALSFTTPQVKEGEFVTATATASNSNTSEFSNAVMVNTAPEAASQSLTTGEDTAKRITLSATDAEGDALAFEINDQPDHGALSSIGTVRCEAATKSCEADLTYRPSKDYYGSDSFSYKATDGELESQDARVGITVNSLNDNPKATDDAFSVDEDQTLIVPDGSTDVLANDSDVDGQSLTAVQKAPWMSGPTYGQLALAADGSFTYTPNKDYYGTDSFTYRASDGTLESSTATVRITVKDTTAPNAPVITSPAEGSYDNDGSFTISGTAEPHTSVEIFNGGNSPSEAAAVNAEGNWFFELSNVSEGSHSYTVKATDGAGNTSAASEALAVIVDKTAPGAPRITYPAQGTRLNYRSFSLSGTAEAGAKVELFEGTISKGTATAGTDGKWKIALSGISEGSHSYTAKATDQAGNTSALSSTRTVIVDTTKAKVTSVVPAENATAVWDENVTATFSEAMKATTINTTTFKLFKQGSTTAIAANVNYDPVAKKATLNPDALLEVGVTYKAVVTTGAKDLAGNALDQDPTLTGNQNKVWYFKVVFDPTDQ